MGGGRLKHLLLLGGFVALAPELPAANSCDPFFRKMVPAAYDKAFNKVNPRIDIVNVDPGDQVEVHAPTQASTDGLHTCLGIAILNVKTRKAYLFHDISRNEQYLEFVGNALNGADASDLRVALVGEARKGFHPQLTTEIVAHLKGKGLKDDQIASFLGTPKGQLANGSYRLRVDPKAQKVFATYSVDD